MNYKNYNDYELIYMVRDNDNESYDVLFSKYTPIIKRIAYDYYCSYKNYGYDLDDFNQEAYIAFNNAVNNFKEEKDILFYSFVILCVRRSLFSFCRKISCERKNISNDYLIDIDSNDVFCDSNIDDYIDYKEIISDVKNISLDLTFIELCIFELKYNGFTYMEISELLDLPLRHIQFKGRKIKKFFIEKALKKRTI